MATQLRDFSVPSKLFFLLTNTISTIQEVLYKINAYIGTSFDTSMPKPVIIDFQSKHTQSIENNLEKSISSNKLSQVLNFTLKDIDTDVNYLPNIDTISDLNGAFKKIKNDSINGYDRMKPKPTFHFVLDPNFFVFPDKIKQEEGEEQIKLNEGELALNFLSQFFDDILDPHELSSSFTFLFRLAQKANNVKDDELSNQMFCNGFVKEYPRQDFEKEKHEHFEKIKLYKQFKRADEKQKFNMMKQAQSSFEERKDLGNIKVLSIEKPSFERPKFTSYLQTINERYGIDKSKLHAQYKKAIHLNINKADVKARLFYVKAGINAKKEKNFKQKIKLKTKSLTLDDPIIFNAFEDFFETKSHLNKNLKFNFPEFLLSSHHIGDHDVVTQLRKQCHDEFNPYLDYLSQIPFFHMAYRYSLFAKELFMLGSFMSRKGQIYIFSTGLKNIFCIVLGQSLKRMTDPGVVFCFAGYVPKENLEQRKYFSEVFGDIDYHETSNNMYFISSWRRLKKTKLAFISDVFYSVLSSSLIDLCKTDIKDLSVNHIKEFYSIRIAVGLNSSQKNAEMLLDFKYLALGSLSKYANLKELLPDKFGPIYPNHFSVWLVNIFWNYCRNIIIQRNLGVSFVDLKVPVFSNETRLTGSTGGKMRIPGFWTSEFFIESFELFLSSLHTYVHSPKEPNSLFFENVKCLNTILKFKNSYEKATIQRQWGYSSANDLKILFRNNDFGFSSTFLYEATKSFFEDNKIDHYKILDNDLFRIPIAHFTSTKASILSNHRAIDKHDRLKVHDALILREDIQHLTLLELCKFTLGKDDYYPLSDMCIKEQYGAKREFYVLDIESKFLCKTLEEYFKLICKTIETECISVPGDLKLLKMQKNVNQIIKHAYYNNQNVYFINGDCTKWSASEVMQSFQTVLYAQKQLMPPFLYDLFMHICEIWKIKELQIPSEICEKINIITEKSDYLFASNGKNFRLKLEQNFLMGLFNYFSSLKASIIYSYAKKIIESHLPNVLLLHLEHSDDYLWSISCKPSQIYWIRTKIAKFMRLGSITDSKKKTTVSTFYCEFVSLFSFNGHMIYPIIKKTKEVSSALTGEGFQSDTAAVASRTSELVRTGCTMTEALIFHKIHNWQLANLYSLLPGQRNFDSKFDVFKKPVEFFGLSEVHPLLYFTNNGDVNNLRLYFYERAAISFLQILMKPMALHEEMEQLTTMDKPKFTYIYTGRKLIKTMSKLNISHEENINFLEKHPVLQFYKPKSKHLLMPYLKSFYSLKSFQKAYEQTGRYQILIRIAYFTSKKCVTFSHYDGSKSIRDFIDCIPIFLAQSCIYEIKEEFLTNGDTAGSIFYGLLKASTFKREYFTSPIRKQLVANYSPFLYNSLKIDTPASLLLLKKYDSDLFELEDIKFSKRWDIDYDMQTLDRLDKYFTNTPLREKIMIIYKNLTAFNKPIKAMMLPFSDRRELLDFYRSMLREQTSNFCKIYINQVQEIIFKNPINSKMRMFYFRNKEIPLERALMLTLLSIYSMMKFKVQF